MKLVTLTSWLGIAGLLSLAGVFAEVYFYGPPDTSLDLIGPNLLFIFRYYVGFTFLFFGLLGLLMSKLVK